MEIFEDWAALLMALILTLASSCAQRAVGPGGSARDLALRIYDGAVTAVRMLDVVEAAMNDAIKVPAGEQIERSNKGARTLDMAKQKLIIVGAWLDGEGTVGAAALQKSAGIILKLIRELESEGHNVSDDIERVLNLIVLYPEMAQ